MIKENIFRNTFNHCIFLHEVKRRSEIDLINCINGVSNLEGTVRVLYQYKLLKNLSHQLVKVVRKSLLKYGILKP